MRASQALDDAVRAAGVDPGGQSSVRDRAIEASAHLIGDHGLAGLTLEAVATAAGCSVHSLYAAFGGRDELLTAIFEQHSPILDAEQIVNAPRDDLPTTVRRVYRMLAHALDREPRVMPALFAEAFARPAQPGLRPPHPAFRPPRAERPRPIARRRGRRRAHPPHAHPAAPPADGGPMLLHFLTRPALRTVPGVDLPTPEQTCEEFATAFLRAVALPPSGDRA